MNISVSPKKYEILLQEYSEAIATCSNILALVPEAKNREYSKELFAIIAIQSMNKGCFNVADVIQRAKNLAKFNSEAQLDFGNIDAELKANASFNWIIQKFSDGYDHTSRLIGQCAKDWEIAMARSRILKNLQEDEQGNLVEKDHKHPAFEKICQLAAAKKNILLVGPAGTGKTHAARQVAEHLGLDFASISVTAGMSVSQLTGWLMPTPTGYLESDFVRLYENGGIFLLDEMDAADANTLTVINQAIANGSFHIPQRNGNSHVKKHPDFVCIAAANTFGTGGDMVYAGREQLDAATLDRFLTVVVDYDQRFEFKKCDPKVLKFVHGVRRGINTLKLRRVMSTRKAIDFSDMVRGESKWTLEDCKECYFAGWSEDEKAKIASFI